MVVLLIGPPGSGKGTQSARLKEWLGIPSISTGDMLRHEIEEKTALGLAAEQVINKGRLLDDDLVGKMLMARLGTAECANGYLLDGYPRTVGQAEFLSKYLAETGRPEPLVLHLEVPSELLVERLSARWSCPKCGHIYNVLNSPSRVAGRCDQEGALLAQREDDRPSAIRQRLNAYHQWTEPVVKYYSTASYCKIDGNRPPTEVFAAIKDCVIRYRVRKSLTGT